MGQKQISRVLRQMKQVFFPGKSFDGWAWNRGIAGVCVK